MPEPSISIESVFSAIERAGFASRGAFRLRREERVGALAEVSTIALIGVTGRRGWDAFAASDEARDGGDDPLDRFSRRVIDGLANRLRAVGLYPFGGPPYWPFQRWAQRAEPVHPSPIGLMIHPEYGLWHSYRGALGFREGLDRPVVRSRPSPCESCLEKPCMRTCPVEAFKTTGYDVPACVRRLRDPEGAECLGRGCLARRACPVGAAHGRRADQAAFAMRAFLSARSVTA